MAHHPLQYLRRDLIELAFKVPEKPRKLDAIAMRLSA